MDVYCKLLQDNNLKVQQKAQKLFRDMVTNHNLRALIDQNVVMIVQALSQNMSSSNVQVRSSGEQIFSLLENVTENVNNLVNPIVSQCNMPQNRSKAQLVELLSSVVLKVDKPNIIDKYVSPLLKPQNKIQIEAQSNQRLKDALYSLHQSVDSVLQKY